MRKLFAFLAVCFLIAVFGPPASAEIAPERQPYAIASLSDETVIVHRPEPAKDACACAMRGICSSQQPLAIGDLAFLAHDYGKALALLPRLRDAGRASHGSEVEPPPPRFPLH